MWIDSIAFIVMLANGSAHPGSTHHDAGLAFERAGHVDDARPGGLCTLPPAQRDVFIRGEKSEVRLVERGGGDGLDEGHFFCNGFELAQCFLVIHQCKIGCGKGRLAEHFIQFLTAQ